MMEKEQLFLPYKVLKEGGRGEIVEKKSRFIATLTPVESEEEAAAFVEEMKKKYWDARHNCSAFVLGERAQITRCSDDGEPGGTAGKPMLEVLLSSEIRNVAAVVTRYFGGTLLGTGGLVRAYTQALQAGLAASRIVTMRYGVRLMLVTDYNGIGKIQYLLSQRNLAIDSSEYTDIVRLILTVPYEEKEEVCKELIESTSGKVKIEELEKFYFVSG
ncbi:YigZ family protein [Kineothrix sp. MB12-C1]|nr:YigZ family protein [Kineothrix sp. MB12-C1]WMC93114.1 YigZ family protein [Kineothrix sp. MB12-C1]